MTNSNTVQEVQSPASPPIQTKRPGLSQWVDRVMIVIAGQEADKDNDFDANADWAIAEQTPRGARVLVWLSAAAVACLLVWASLAQLDEITKGDGKVIPARQIQVIQSMDGGIVSEILVQEGQAVKEGDLLLKVDPTRMISSLRENHAQHLSLMAKAARLRALAEGVNFSAPQGMAVEAPEIVDQERRLFESKRSELEATIGAARQQAIQRTQELVSVRARREQAASSFTLTESELNMTRPLAKTGAVSDVELLRLERDVARFRGERDSASGDIQRIEASINEANRKIQEVDLTFRNAARSELSETVAKLGALTEGSTALEDRVKQTGIRSPVNGTVKQLKINTVGGVVLPGKDLVEIVPSDDVLLLEARILPKDIGFLHPGQRAVVKFTAYDFAIYGGLDATLEQISADSVIDEKGNAFFLVKVRTHTNNIGDKKFPIIPGMVAEVDILTGKRSVLAYLMKPILRAKANAMTER